MNKSHIDMFINIQFSESMSFKLGIGKKKKKAREKIWIKDCYLKIKLTSPWLSSRQSTVGRWKQTTIEYQTHAQTQNKIKTNKDYLSNK